MSTFERFDLTDRAILLRSRQMRTSLGRMVFFAATGVASVFLTLLFNGCVSDQAPSSPIAPSGYTPMGPYPIKLTDNCTNSACYLQLLGDADMRLAVGEMDGSGNITYGPAAFSASGSNYTVILDYIKCTTKPYPIVLTNPAANLTTAHPHLKIAHYPSQSEINSSSALGTPPTFIPVYVGVGIRMTAHISVIKGSLTVGSISAIGAAAQAGQVTGDLSFQLLGISGPEIEAAYSSIPSDINTTAIQDALVAMGTIKSKIYDTNTEIMPEIVGVENLFGVDQATLNQYVSELMGANAAAGISLR